MYYLDCLVHCLLQGNSKCPKELRRGDVSVIVISDAEEKEDCVIEPDKNNADTINMTNGSHRMIYASQRRVILRAIIYANHRLQAAPSDIMSCQIMFCHNVCMQTGTNNKFGFNML